ncbi:MAG TPA: hypothetical protein VM053_12560 [Gemmatimonadaceae bacterium]|nr:hypothetical protein [Gemmatimonadaceae bacterium]
MKGSLYIAAAALVAAVGGAAPASAQCSGNGTCSTTNTASVTVGTVVNLEMSSSSTTLTAPAPADFAAGFVADVGPTFVVHANQNWTMAVKAAASNPTSWSYTGTKGGSKPIGDLEWSVAVDGTFAALTGSNATVASSASSTDDTAVSLFFKTLYSSDYSSVRNRPGAYSLPVVFTLSAP